MIKVFVIFLILGSGPLVSQGWQYITGDTTQNIVLRNISKIYQLKSTGGFFVADKNDQYFYKDGKFSIIDNKNYKYIGNFYTKIFEDSHQNQIIVSHDGFVVENIDTSYHYDLNNIANMNQLADVLLIGDTLYALEYYRIFKFHYNKDTKVYDFNKNNTTLYYLEGDTVWVSGSAAVAVDSNIFVSRRDSLYKININTNKVELMLNLKSKFGANYKSSKYLLYKNNTFILATVNNDTTSSIYTISKDFNNITELAVLRDDDFKKYLPQISDIALYKDYIIASMNTKLYIIKDNKTFLIDRPNIIEKPDDVLQDNWNIREIYIDDQENLWLGSFFYGIFKININELISTLKVEDERFLGIKTLQIRNVYPTPNRNSLLSIDYNNLVASSEVNLEMFNLTGEKVDKKFFNIVSNIKIVGNLYKMQVQLNDLNKNIYFIKLFSQNVSEYQKIIIE